MPTPNFEDWTIVVNGRWNVSIFGPDWLTTHIFDSQEVEVEVGLSPGTPRRIRGDGVVLIPTSSRLIVAMPSSDDTTLLRSEHVVSKILDTLPHTPIGNVGVNFGFTVEPSELDLSRFFNAGPEERFADAHLPIMGRGASWTLSYAELQLNIGLQISEGQNHLKFNYHSPSASLEVAKQVLTERILTYRDHASSLIEQVFS